MSVYSAPGHFAFALAALGLGVVCLFVPSHYVLPLIVVALTDGYIASILWIVAVASQQRYQGTKGGLREWLPHPTTAFVMLPTLALALMTAFAELYIETAGVQSSTQRLETRSDALYFSAVTITTLGYGDFAPRSGSAKFFVVVELSSGILLLVGAVPLLISRMANFDEARAAEGGRDIVFETLRITLPAAGDGEITIVGGTLTWRGAGSVLTVTRSPDGSLRYTQDGRSALADPAKPLVIDDRGRARQA